VALILSFIGALFVGPALGAGLALVAVVALSIVLGDSALANTVGTTLTLAGSGVLFLGAWWIFYRLARRIFE
jgi:hypothetical protein